jgi:hypothetical protein
MTRYTLTLFTPGETAKITGVSPDLQRDWRRRGYLPVTDYGHNRFGLHGLAHMLFLKSMADRGIGPQHSQPLAEIAAGGIALGALSDDAAFDAGNSRQHMEGALRQTTPSKIVRRIMPTSLLIIWADATERWDNSFDNAVASIPAKDVAKKLAGPVTALHQFELGALLRRRAKRPLVHVEVEDD